jgi:hypothetical protein
MAKATGRASDLVERAERLHELIASRGSLLAGSLYTARTRCGRKACKCMSSDYRHRNRCLSFYENGKSRTRTVPDPLIETVRDLTGAYRDAKARRRGIAKAARELLNAVDAAIAQAARRGQKDLLTALAQHKGGAE